jgi:hypothetical protein
MVPRLAILDLFHFGITCEVLSQCYILLTSRTFESILVSGSRHDPIGLRQRPMQSRFVWSFQVPLSVRETSISEAKFPLRR